MCFCVMLLLTACGKNEKMNTIKSYGQILGEWQKNSDNDIHSKLLIFPEPEMVTDYIKDWNYDEQQGLFDGKYQLSITCNYDEKTYQEEEKRLGIINTSYNGVQQSVKCMPIENEYLAYITIYDGTGTYEYAILDEENKSIVYVYSQLGELEDIVDEEYIIKQQDIENQISTRLNIYYFLDKDGGYSFID